MWSKFARQPQSVWLRRVLLQIHLWVGIGIGIYVVLISVSGSAIVYRVELDKFFSRHIPLLAPSGVRMTDVELASLAKAAYSRFKVEEVQVRARPSPDAAVEISLISGSRKLERRFNPYTGEDLGDIINTEPRFVTWLVEFHTDLLAKQAGRWANGVGALLMTLLCMTGLVIWWPGVARWKRSLSIRASVSWRRLNWDLHSVIGMGLLLPILMWTVTGVYLTFPTPFERLMALLENNGLPTPSSLSLDAAFVWLVRLHFGRSFGPWVRALWAILGLMPPALFITGLLMWWNRSLRRRRRHLWDVAPGAPPPQADILPLDAASD